MNNITTVDITNNNIVKNVKIESKKISAKCIPYFFSTIKAGRTSYTKNK